MSDTLKVIVKKKFIPTLVEFCLDESLEFNVKPQAFPDTDWEVTLKMADIKTAVVAGMFFRENKIEIAGVDQQKYKKAPAVKKGKEEEEKPEESKTHEPKVHSHKEDKSEPGMF
jgi:basic membrane lipoprotein Med (substrate-binding protein (PBP1-ABC) superfamily)